MISPFLLLFIFKIICIFRNSSPSVSMFGGLHSSRDRISPQAIQELLEFSRTSGIRRAASPDSRFSSRSPSPPTSSGRTSPGILLLGCFKSSPTSLLFSLKSANFWNNLVIFLSINYFSLFWYCFWNCPSQIEHDYIYKWYEKIELIATLIGHL